MKSHLRRFPEHLLLLTLLIVIILASGSDIVLDLGHGADRMHIVQEVAITLLAIVALIWVAYSLYQKIQEIQALRASLLAQHKASADHGAAINRQLAGARHELAQEIERQFQRWDLSPSEREIGKLLIKGLSLKEISLLRETTEKTVRQQASSIYQKSGLNGRHAFSAWFIEDLL